MFDPKFFLKSDTNCVSGRPVDFSNSTLQDTRPFKCHNCSCAYKQKGHLQQHLTYECGVEPKFTCKYCGRQIKRKHNYLLHIRSMHGSFL